MPSAVERARSVRHRTPPEAWLSSRTHARTSPLRFQGELELVALARRHLIRAEYNKCATMRKALKALRVSQSLFYVSEGLRKTSLSTLARSEDPGRRLSTDEQPRRAAFRRAELVHTSGRVAAHPRRSRSPTAAAFQLYPSRCPSRCPCPNLERSLV